MITVKEVNGLIALAVVNNRDGFISAMNKTGNAVASDISNDDLMRAGQLVYINKGYDAIRAVLQQVPVNKSSLSDVQKDQLTKKFQPDASQYKFKDWFNNAVGTVGDLLGGYAVTDQPSASLTTTSILPAWVIPASAITSIIVIAILFSKGVKNAFPISLVIGGIFVALVLYGVLAKDKKQTGGGGTSTSHGGIGAAIVQGLGALFA